ncbi:MAG: SEC-C domain-containing protein [Planctomycetes bacterium]|nr:SEC-C domain-containing protein [Planctomycetota bacterium]
MTQPIPSSNDQCPCGSGYKFRTCCRARYDEATAIRPITEALDDGRTEAALQLSRAYVTRYVIWHRQHTVPLVKADAAAAEPILALDIAALSDIVDILCTCYEAGGQREDVPGVLDRLATAIDDPRWTQRIIYHRTIWSLGSAWNEEAGRRAMSAVGSIDEIADPQTLQLFLSLHHDELGFAESSKAIDRVIAAANDPVTRLHYRSLKGLEFVFIGDLDAGCEEIDGAIAEFRTSESMPCSGYARYRLALSLLFLGQLRDDPKSLEEARGLFEQELTDTKYSKSGRAMLRLQIADTYRSQCLWEDAKDSYLQSLDLEDSPIARMELARCALALGDHPTALAHLHSVGYDAITPREQLDHCIVAAQIAHVVKDAALVEQTADRLKATTPHEPYFREARDQLVISLLSIQDDATDEEANVGFIRKVGDLLGRYLMLQPNFCGLGINVNALLRHEKKGDSER